jgi:uncharacterized protein
MVYNFPQYNIVNAGKPLRINGALMTISNLAEDKIRLADLHGCCELNYMRLMRLCPDLRLLLDRELRAGPRQQFGLHIAVTERSPFTTMVRLSLSMANTPWAGFQNMALRVYHDARMVEVVRCDERRIDRIRYDYPNKAMHQPDEKMQLNQFLGIWFDYFLAQGCEKSLRTMAPTN